MAQDLKIRSRLSPAQVYAGVPEFSILRILVATQIVGRHRYSSTDFDTAYLQAHKSPIPHLVRFFDYLTFKLVYAYLYSALYGKQDSAKRWKDTLKGGLVEMGFEEIHNVASVYRHVKRDIILIVHVDDPLVRTVSEEDVSSSRLSFTCPAIRG